MQNQEDTLRNALHMAKTPAGQQLIQKLQQSGGDDLRNAVQKAASGDYAQAKQLLTALAENPDIQQLIDQLRR